MLLFLISCNKNSEKLKDDLEPSFFDVDIERGINSSKQLKISSIADSVDYIVLETNSECLIPEIKDIRINDNSIVILAENTGREIFVFSRSGKFLNKIGKQGRAPKEYYNINDYIVYDDNVLIVDYGNRLAQYKITGEFVRYLKLPKQASRITKAGDHLFACYIPDSFFGDGEELYNWLIINPEGDSVNSIKLDPLRGFSEKKLVSNHYVLTDFSSEYFSSFKEAFNDTLYYIDSLQVKPFGFLNLGIHKIDYTKTFDEIATAKHNMRINGLTDTKKILFINYSCMCKGNETTHHGVYNKETQVFFNVVSERSDEKIIDNFDGPDFWPLTCNKNQLIGYVNAIECINLADFSQKLNINENDNPVIILAYINS